MKNMSKDSDTAIAIAYRKQVIKQNISVDTCKECNSFTINNNLNICNLINPHTYQCNLLKIFNTK